MGALTQGLLDTSILVAGINDLADPTWQPDEACISIISIAELHYGLLKAKDDRVRRLRAMRLGAIEAKLPVLPITAQVARAYAMVADIVSRAGRSPRPRSMDLWIAATAFTNNLPLYTLNMADLAGLEGHIDIRTKTR